ncbi:hypothetical protein PRIPAC_70759 [Pristionchus pacificus]|uniref:Uncharacterized protein n=1 Tax=Pristionchus pacificus TaxID=54126 RepID=A0A2A6BRF2_PRIPA|nr:hypothetical protein PRIPAC_70759 [Pristionchus pacificus]|eukprot:PDM68447.1 hypothetical protein PRIPAC_43949 [Pristionchus pacificus]
MDNNNGREGILCEKSLGHKSKKRQNVEPGGSPLHIPSPYLLCSNVLRVPARAPPLTSIESMQFLRSAQLGLARLDLLLPLQDVLGEGRRATQDRIGRLAQVLVQTERVLECSLHEWFIMNKAHQLPIYASFTTHKQGTKRNPALLGRTRSPPSLLCPRAQSLKLALQFGLPLLESVGVRPTSGHQLAALARELLQPLPAEE